ncbi:MAG: oligosaccharide flippase family protein [Ferruginibacter sp.]
MGIIQRQGLRSSIFLMIGFCIGGINTVFLFPKIFTQEEIGLTRALLETATVLSVLASLGTTPVIYKFFPFYKSRLSAGQNDLPLVTGLICLAGFIFIMIVGFIFKDFIIRKLGRSPLFADNIFLIIPFTFIILGYIWMEAFGWALKKTVLTNFLKETLIRIVTLVLVVFVGINLISKQQFMELFSMVYLLPAIILLVVLWRSGEWKLQSIKSIVTHRYKRKMITFGMFVFGASFLNIASRTVDSFMIIGLKGLAETAVFLIATYLVTFMDLPLRSINSIATPVIAESWKEKNYKNIETVYYKSTITLMVAGVFIFSVVMLNIDNLVVFLGQDWALVPQVALIMGISKLVDLSTGVNGQIISTSSNWRFDFFTNVLLTLLAFPLNFFLIKAMGIMGAAWSNLIAITAYNAVRYLFIYKKYGWQPYHFGHLKIILLSIIFYLLVAAVPFIMNIFLDSVFRTVLFSALFVPAILKMNISEEFTSIAHNVLRKTRLKK